MSVLDVENLRLHYAKTLDHWQQRFESASPAIAAMFDEPFVRAWRLYLAGSGAAFATGWMQLFQIVFARCASNTIPWTRAASCGTESDLVSAPVRAAGIPSQSVEVTGAG